MSVNVAPNLISGRLRVFSFVPHLRCGGTENQLIKLTEHCDPNRFDRWFGFLDSAAIEQDNEAVSRWPLKAYPISTFLSPSAVRQVFRLARDLRKIRPHVLHSYNFYANVFSIPAARLAGVPCIVASIRDMGVYMTPMQKRVHRSVCRLADRVAVNAEAIKTWLAESGYPAEKIRVIRNGVEIPEHADTDSRAELRAELGIPISASVAIMTARLNPKKGVEDLLVAAVKVLGEMPNAWFVIVGDVVLQSREKERAYSERLNTLALELGISERVLFTGYRRDVAALLKMADVSVLPSWSEGLPNAVLEAMAAGVPVVSTRVGGVPELIDDGVTGVLVDPHDVAGLGRALIRVMSDRALAKRISSAARERASVDFSFDRVVGVTEALYREVLADQTVNRRRSLSSLLLS